MSFAPWSLQGETDLVHKSLALAHSKRDPVALFEVIREQYAIPQVLVVARVPRRLKQILSHLPPLRAWKARWASGMIPILQSRKAFGEQSMYPILDASRRVAVNAGCFIATESPQDMKNDVQPMIIASFSRPKYLILHTGDKSLRIRNFDALHREPPPLGSHYITKSNYAQLIKTFHINMEYSRF
jgi:hypothetical protein